MGGGPGGLSSGDGGLQPSLTSGFGLGGEGLGFGIGGFSGVLIL